MQALLEHGSVSLVLLAGGVGKRMGVGSLISARTNCICLMRLVACETLHCSLTTCCLWPKLVLGRRDRKHGSSVRFSWDASKLPPYAAGINAKAVSASAGAAHSHVQPADTVQHGRDWRGCHRVRSLIPGDMLNNAMPACSTILAPLQCHHKMHTLRKTGYMLIVVDRYQAVTHIRIMASITCKKRATLSACRDATGVPAWCRRCSGSTTDCCQRSRP